MSINMKRFTQLGAVGALVGAAVGCIVLFSLWMRQFYEKEVVDARKQPTHIKINMPPDVDLCSPKTSAEFWDNPLPRIAREQFRNGDEEAALETIETIDSADDKDQAISSIIEYLLSKQWSDSSEKLAQQQAHKALKLVKRIHDSANRSSELLDISRTQFRLGQTEPAAKTLELAKRYALKAQNEWRDSTPDVPQPGGQGLPTAIATLDVSPTDSEGKTEAVYGAGSESVREADEPTKAQSAGWHAALWPIAFSVFGFLLAGMAQPILTAIGSIGGRSFAEATGFDALRDALEKNTSD